MFLIATVDDGMGMAFNNRRQSSDRAVTKRIAQLAAGSCLWVNAYTKGLFAQLPDVSIRTDENPLKKAGPGEYCFLENIPPKEGQDGLEGVILFRWNRRYPSDTRFGIDLSGFALIRTEEFEGHSHKNIIMETYVHGRQGPGSF